MGAAVARILAKDRDVRVVSVYAASPVLLKDLRRLFPDAEPIRDPASRAYAASCRRLGVDLILSAHCPVIIPQSALDAAPLAYNLHPGLLPHGRGYWPTYWALIDRSPSGATLHRMVAKVDRGPIAAQVRVRALPTDDGETITRRVQAAEVEMFRRCWPRLKAGRLRERRARGGGAYHSKAEGLSVRRLDRAAMMPVGRVIDLLRAFTDSRFDGCSIVDGGRRVYLRLSLYEKKRAASAPRRRR